MEEKIFFQNSKDLKICGIFEEPNLLKKQIVIKYYNHDVNIIEINYLHG